MNPAVVVQQVARLPFPAEGGGSSPTPRLHFERVPVADTRAMLTTHHYLGPVSGGVFAFAGWVDDVMACCQVFRHPTARMVPQDWLELSRWCITPLAGKNAGSRMMRWVAGWLRKGSDASTLVSYSDPVHGHTGSLYRASGWVASPTHHTDRFKANGVGYPSGHGSWDGKTRQAPKERWLYQLRGTA